MGWRCKDWPIKTAALASDHMYAAGDAKHLSISKRLCRQRFMWRYVSVTQYPYCFPYSGILLPSISIALGSDNSKKIGTRPFQQQRNVFQIHEFTAASLNTLLLAHTTLFSMENCDSCMLNHLHFPKYNTFAYF